ncbi:hypothetical protein [Paenirhodobacter enshiensis]|uniref:hypothetical protein n=1 Tax=Paenirhodobacter enshiensis TaxID=1105367 RepID=UPI001267E184|nr:hypothetical protein [Paenirhodobacter enshiensis]
MPTKALQRFEDRVSTYDSDLELADLLVNRFLNLPNSASTVCLALGGAAAKYPKINQRVNTRKARNIYGLHLKVTLYSSFIKDLYEDFSEYLANILKRAALSGVNAGQFQGDAKVDFQAKDILQAGSWDNAIALISEKVFRTLEDEKSTKKLITKISTRLGLALDQATLDAALPYLDARHLLVHRDGRVDAVYTGSYPAIPTQDGKLKLDFDFVRNARSNVRSLAAHIDARLCAANLLRPQDLVGAQQA